MINIAGLEVAFLERQQQWQSEVPSAEITAAQQTVAWADHIGLFFPLWMGTVPAKLKAFFEQTLRPDFVRGKSGGLRGTSVRLVVTMGMPAFIYHRYFGAHGLKNCSLTFCNSVALNLCDQL